MNGPSIFDTYGAFDVVAIERDHLRREYSRAIARGDIVGARIALANLRALSSTPGTG